MAQQDRDGFTSKLRQTASDRAIPIERLSCRDLPGKNAFELTIESGGTKRVVTVSDFESIKNRDAEIELIISQILAPE
jgi:hypothetical protein